MTANKIAPSKIMLLLQKSSTQVDFCKVQSAGKRRTHGILILNSALKHPKEPEHSLRKTTVSSGILKLAALAALHCFCSQPAYAWGQTWRPRRHLRRLDQKERDPDLGKYTKVNPTPFTHRIIIYFTALGTTSFGRTC